MTIEMINQWFGIERMGERFMVRDIAGMQANLATRDDAIAWIDAEMARIDTMDNADEPEATADEYLAS